MYLLEKYFFLHELINGDLWREFPLFFSMTFFSSSLKGYDKNWLISYENVLYYLVKRKFGNFSENFIFANSFKIHICDEKTRD